MATLNAAVQLMIDNLHARMAANTATPEDQVLISKALTLLHTGATWEQALVAVATQHLETATNALAAAKVAVEGSNALLGNHIAAMALLPDISERIDNGFSKFNAGYDFTDAIIYRTSHNLNQGEGTVSRIAWVASLDDFETGTFTCLFGTLDGNNTAVHYLVRIDAKKNVFSATLAATVFPLGSGQTFGLLPSTDNSVIAIRSATATSYAIHNGTTGALIATFGVDTDRRLYLDPATRKSYVRNSSGTLIEITALTAQAAVPGMNFATVGEFDTYALAQGWVQANNKFATSSGDSVSSMSTVAMSAPRSTTHAPLFGGGATANNSFVSFTPEYATSKFSRLVGSTSGSLHVENNYSDTQGTPNFGFCKASFKASMTRPYGGVKYLEVTQRPRYIGQTGSNVHIRPLEIISFSHLHNACLHNSAMYEMNPATSYYTYRVIGVSFGE